MRALKFTLAGLFILLLVLLGFMTVAVSTTWGARQVLDLARGQVPALAHIGGVGGSLAEELVLDDVQWQDATLRATVARVQLRWRPATLLSRRVHVELLQLDGVSIQPLDAAQPPPPSEPFQLPERIELPVAVQLDQLRVGQVTLIGSDASSTVLLDGAQASADLTNSTLHLRQISVNTPQGQLSLDAQLQLHTHYALQAEVAATLISTDRAPLPIKLTASGNLQQLQLDWTAAAPYDAHGSATLTNVLTDLRLLASVNVEDAQLANISSAWPQYRLRLAAEADGSIDALKVSLDTRVTGVLDAALAGTPEGAAPSDTREQTLLQSSVAAEWRDQGLHISTLTLQLPGQSGELQAKGVLQQAGELNLNVHWQHLQWPLLGAPQVVSNGGSIDLAGQMDGYTLAARASALLMEPAMPVQFELDGQGDANAFGGKLSAQLLQGSVQGTFAAEWLPALTASLTLSGEGVNPEALLTGWPGQVAFQLQASVRTEQQQLHAAIEQFDVNGSLRERPLQLNAKARYGPSQNEADLQLSLGRSTLSVQANSGPIQQPVTATAAQLTWRIASKDLGDFDAALHGRVEGAGTLTGPLDTASIRAELHAMDLDIAGAQLASLDAAADLQMSNAQPSSLRISARQGVWQDVELKSLVLDGQGTPAEHRMSVNADSNRGHANVALRGALDAQDRWAFQLAEGEFAAADLAPWVLAESTSGRIDAERSELGNNCWTSQAARLCANGSFGAGALRGEVTLTDLPIAYFRPLLPPDIGVQGTLRGRAQVSQDAPGQLRADVSLTSSPGQLTMLDGTQGTASTTPIRYELQEASLKIGEQDAALRVRLALQQGSIDLDAALAAPPSAPGSVPVSLTAGALSGRLRMQLPDLSFIAQVTPQLTRFDGRVEGDVGLSGTLVAPALAGQLALLGGAADIPAIGVQITDLSASLSSAPGQDLQLRATARAGPGQLQFDGQLSPLGDVPRADLHLHGEDFQVADTDAAVLRASPDLRIELRGADVWVRGAVSIPYARITPTELPASAAQVSDDQKLVYRQTAQSSAAPTNVNADLEIRLGEDVRVDGFGLTGQLTGAVKARQRVAEPVTGTGELQIVGGEYRAYGQGLVIERGRVLFAGGPIDQPALDMRAVRRPAEGILVGARVTGPVRNPTFALFSEPPMSEQERLSYLILGRSLQESPGSEGSALSQALLTAGLRGGEFLAKYVGQGLGVDEFTIKTGSGEAGAASDPNQAELVIGKYLSPDLYISYGLGLFDPVSVLRVQYSISEQLKLVAESSAEGSGADLQYRITR